MKLFDLLNKFEIYELNLSINPELRYEYDEFNKKKNKYIFSAKYDGFTAKLVLTPNDEKVLFVEKAILDSEGFTGWKMFQDGTISLLN